MIREAGVPILFKYPNFLKRKYNLSMICYFVGYEHYRVNQSKIHSDLVTGILYTEHRASILYRKARKLCYKFLVIKAEAPYTKIKTIVQVNKHYHVTKTSTQNIHSIKVLVVITIIISTMIGVIRNMVGYRHKKSLMSSC
jgi:hypothetical protein